MLYARVGMNVAPLERATAIRHDLLHGQSDSLDHPVGDDTLASDNRL